VRSAEISEQVPPVSAIVLEKAYRLALQDQRPVDWQLAEQMPPYEVLEVLPTATWRMVDREYRVIVNQVHPDKNSSKKEWASRMMQIVNGAYEKVKHDRGQ